MKEGDDALRVIERRERVWRHKMFGVTNRAIAKIEDVSERTVEDDMKWLRSNAKRLVESVDELLDIGMTLKRLEEMVKMFWEKYATTNDEKMKFAILSKITDIEEQLERIKINTGMWTKVPDRIGLGVATFEQTVIEMRKKRGLSVEPKDVTKLKLIDGRGAKGKKKSKDDGEENGTLNVNEWEVGKEKDN